MKNLEAKVLTIIAIIALIGALVAMNIVVDHEDSNVPTTHLSFNTDSTTVSIPGIELPVETTEPFVDWFDQIESVTIRKVEYALGKPTYLIWSFDVSGTNLEYPRHWPEHHYAYLKRAL